MSTKAEAKNATRPGERLAVVFLDPAAGSRDAELIRAGASEAGARCTVSESAAQVVDSLRAWGDGLVIFLAADLPRRGAQARELYRAFPHSEIVFLSPSNQQTTLKRELGPAPMIGVNWTVVDPAVSDLRRVVVDAVRALQQRVQFRTTLDRFNVQITNRPIDANERRRLLISDRFLASILESVGEAVVSADLSGRVLTLNRAALALFDVRQPDVIGRRLHSLLGGEWSVTVDTLMDRLGAGNTDQFGTCTATPRSGRTIDLAITLAYIRDEAGVPAAVSLVVRDLTEIRQSEEALRRAEKLAAVGRLAASISHEINNPLEAVTNLLYILEHTPGIDEQSLEYIRTAQREVARVTHIASQTLSFYREPTRPVEISLSRLLDESLEIFASKVAAKRIHVVRRYRTEQTVIGFPGELRQVISNLVLNAIEAVPVDGAVAVGVSRTTSREGTPGIAILVADNGPGISTEELQQIFEAFYTTKKEKGTGLGLWVVKSIVAKLSGTIRVRSSMRPDRRGTTFRVFVPLTTQPS